MARPHEDLGWKAIDEIAEAFFVEQYRRVCEFAAREVVRHIFDALPEQAYAGPTFELTQSEVSQVIARLRS